MNTPETSRVRLARELERLRRFAGLSTRSLAEKLPISQATVSRAENGKALLSGDEVNAWAEATGADADTRALLLELANAALREELTWGGKLAGRAHLQDEMRAMESSAWLVRNFQPTVIPGLLQTPEYAHYVIPISDVDNVVDHPAALAARLARQPVLFTGERQFEFLLGEAVLRWPASAPELLTAQLERIVALSSLQSVQVGVLPWGEPSDALGWHNFVLFEGEEPFVSVELVHRAETVTDPHQVDLYRRVYARMWQRALVGPGAVAFIQRVAAELRDRGAVASNAGDGSDS